jgi:hypothetical protein
MKVLVLFLLGALALFGQCSITLRVVNVAGNLMPYRVTSFKDAYGGEHGHQFDGLHGIVSCNRTAAYTFEAKWIGASTRVADITKVEGKVMADQPEKWLTVSTDPGVHVNADGTEAVFVNSSMPRGYVWRGRVLPLPQERLWIYLRSAIPTSPITVASQVEAETDEAGEFRVYGAVYKGPYLLYVMNKSGKVLHTMLLRPEGILLDEPLEVTLPSTPPSEVILK